MRNRPPLPMTEAERTGLVLDAAREYGFQPSPAIAASRIYREGSESGMGREDDSRAERVYRTRRANVPRLAPP